MSYVIRSMIKEFGNSAENMLYHFHCVLQGPRPFAAAKKDLQSFKKRVKLDGDALQYIKDVLLLLQADRKSLEFI